MLRRWLQQLELLKPKDEETAAVLGACFIKVDGQCKAMIMMSLVELSYAVWLPFGSLGVWEYWSNTIQLMESSGRRGSGTSSEGAAEKIIKMNHSLENHWVRLLQENASLEFIIDISREFIIVENAHQVCLLTFESKQTQSWWQIVSCNREQNWFAELSVCTQTVQCVEFSDVYSLNIQFL